MTAKCAGRLAVGRADVVRDTRTADGRAYKGPGPCEIGGGRGSFFILFLFFWFDIKIARARERETEKPRRTV